MTSEQVLHLDLLSLAPGVDAAARRTLFADAGRLAEIEPVLTAGVIEAEGSADYDLAFYYVLPGFGALEPFGTDARYIRFLQGSVAPVLAGLAGADVRLDGDFPAPKAYAALLALMAPDQTYDWEVRQALSDWARASHASPPPAGKRALRPAQEGPDGRTSRDFEAVIGLAVGERQRFRGLAIVFGDAPVEAAAVEDRRFGVTLVRGKARSLA